MKRRSSRCGQAEHARALAFAATHPRLQRVVLDMRNLWLDPPAEVTQAVAAARERKPNLSVVFTPSMHWVTRVALEGDAALAEMHQVF